MYKVQFIGKDARKHASKSLGDNYLKLFLSKALLRMWLSVLLCFFFKSDTLAQTPTLPSVQTTFDWRAGTKDYIIPQNPFTLFVTVVGGRGGDTGGECGFKGGSGAYISVSFAVNDDCTPQSLLAGGTLRFIAGASGQNDAGDRRSAAGGGGSALLYKAPLSDVWQILVVAGGGGGASDNVQPFFDFCSGQNGGDAQLTVNGGDGGGVGGKGGVNGYGGNGWLLESFGGGGAFGNAVSIGNPACSGKGGFPNGAPDSDCDDKYSAIGGSGFGAGGAGVFGGGGGGGYSGGGGGSTFSGGGGGGSYISAMAYVLIQRLAVVSEGGEIEFFSIKRNNYDPVSVVSPTLNSLQFVGCNVLEVVNNSGLSYSVSPKTITNSQFTAGGGAVKDGSCNIQIITYSDLINPTDNNKLTRTFVITDVAGNTATCTQLISAINPAVSASLSPSAQNVCSGAQPATLSVDAFSAASITVQWYSSESAIFSEATPIPGAVSGSYSPPASTIIGKRYYFARVVDGCGSAVIKRATVTVIDNAEWVLDNDNDGYYTGDVIKKCFPPGVGYTIKTNQQAGDCDDNNASINSTTFWLLDEDGDGYHNRLYFVEFPTCLPPQDGRNYINNSKGQDCNDGDATDNPETVWVKDADGDGYYVGEPYIGCFFIFEPGYVRKANQQPGDCDDTNAAIKAATFWLLDEDGDGYHNRLYFVEFPTCLPPQDGRNYINNSKGQDCNDGDATDNPETVWVKDADGDGYYVGELYIGCFFIFEPGYVRKTNQQPGDCDDTNAAIKAATFWLLDEDGDGYHNRFYFVEFPTCLPPQDGRNYINNSKGQDCNDGDATDNPETVWVKDADGDGYYVGEPYIGCFFIFEPGYVRKTNQQPGDCDDGDKLINPATQWIKDNDGDGYFTGSPVISCTSPGSGYIVKTTQQPGDCNDADAEITLAVTWYLDADGDGYAASTISSCTSPGVNYTSNVLPQGDCDDANAAINPATVWYEDRDNDGYRSGSVKTGCERPKFYYGGIFDLNDFTYGKLASEFTNTGLDCDDANASINPGVIWYKDVDNDGFSDGTSQQACYQPVNYKRQGTVATGGDCDDADAAINPNTKWYPDVDNDRYSTGNFTVQCTRPMNHKLPRELTSITGDCNDNNAILNPNTNWLKDADNDGYTNGVAQRQCLRPTGFKLSSELTNSAFDCNDENAAINPATQWYKDADDDGYSDGTTKTQCAQPAGYKLATALTSISSDCDDANPVLNPATAWYKDADDDGYGSGDMLTQCNRPPLYKLASELSETFGDCNDLNPSINPVAAEICGNRIDDNCNGITDEVACVQCGNATTLTTINITSNSATLQWMAVANPDQWQIQYKTTNKGSKWVDVFVTGNKRSVTINSLPANQNYNWQIRAKCGKSWTAYASAVAFKTTGIGSAVEARTYEIVESPTFEVITAPNPSDSYFTLTVKSSNTTDRILVRVMDELGRVVEQKENVMSGTRIRFGDKYIPGMYFIMVQQGKNSKAVKLIRR